MDGIGFTTTNNEEVSGLSKLLITQTEQAGVYADKIVRRVEPLGVTFDPTETGLDAVAAPDWIVVAARFGTSVLLAKALCSLAFQAQMVASLSAPLLDDILAGSFAVDPAPTPPV
jgi:hypothetical protein